MPRIKIRLNHVTNLFRISVNGKTQARVEEVESIFQSGARRIRGYNYSEGKRVLEIEV